MTPSWAARGVGDLPVPTMSRAVWFEGRETSTSHRSRCAVGWRQADIDDGIRDGLTTAEQSEMVQLRRDKRWLEMENEILRRAAAYLPRSAARRRDRLATKAQAVSPGVWGAQLPTSRKQTRIGQGRRSRPRGSA